MNGAVAWLLISIAIVSESFIFFRRILVIALIVDAWAIVVLGAMFLH